MGSGLRTVHLIAILSMLLLGCAACTKPVPVQPTDDAADANVAPAGTDQAAYARMDQVGQACTVLRWLKCPEGSPDGDTCERSMGLLVGIGTFEKKNLLCVREARTVEKVRTCNVECKVP